MTIIAVLAVLAAMRMAQEVLIPIVLSILIAYALDPIVAFFSKIGLGRATASAVVLLAILGALGTTAYSLRGQAATVLDQLPEGARRMRSLIAENTGGEGPLKKCKRLRKELEQAAAAATAGSATEKPIPQVQIAQPAPRASDYLWWGSIGAMAWMGQAVVIFFMVYFLLASGDQYQTEAADAGRALNVREKAVDANPQGNRRPNRAIPAGADQYERGGLGGDVAGARLYGRESAGRVGNRRRCAELHSVLRRHHG